MGGGGGAGHRAVLISVGSANYESEKAFDSFQVEREEQQADEDG